MRTFFDVAFVGKPYAQPDAQTGPGQLSQYQLMVLALLKMRCVRVLRPHPITCDPPR